MKQIISRLALCLCIGLFLLTSPPQARADGVTHVTDWAHLLPEGLYDFFPQDMATSLWVDPEFQKKIVAAERKIRPELNNKLIVLPGYMVPLVYKGDTVTEFLLVPSAGQCIHVPPPPVNQTVYVALDMPTRIRTYGEPLIVEGVLLTRGEVTEYAETGYRIEAYKISDFSFEALDSRLEELEGSKP